MAPGFQSATVSVEHTLFSGCNSREKVEVEYQTKNQKEWFVVQWRVNNMRARLRVVKSVATEFVAQGEADLLSLENLNKHVTRSNLGHEC